MHNVINAEIHSMCIQTVQMMHATYYLFSVKIVKTEMNNCCSNQCKEIHDLPYEEQKALRQGQGNSNDIFKKGRADHLPYKKDLRNIFETLKNHYK